MSLKQKKKWAQGSVFLIPLVDSRFSVGLVLGHEKSALNSVSAALFDVLVNSADESIPLLSTDKIFSIILVTKDLLDSGRWKVIGEDKSLIDSISSYLARIRSHGYVGAKIRGSANVEEFINAFYGLMPWDDWYIPNYLDDFLLSPDKKPIERIMLSGRHGK